MSDLVFVKGKHEVWEARIEPNNPSPPSPPPKPLYIAASKEEGKYPVVLFLHGYLLFNTFYSQLLRHVASHGFIVVAPQLYQVAGPDSTDEIESVTAITDWLLDGLPRVLPSHVQPNLCKIAVAGHIRGGKVAFAFALGHANTPKISALIGIDPIDGMEKGKQTTPRVLTYVPQSFNLDMPVLVVGSGLGELKKYPLFPPCAHKGVNHEDFFKECRSPACYFVAKDYGYLDMLDDETNAIGGTVACLQCKNGEARDPMRRFVGGVVVAFLKAYLEDDLEDLTALEGKPGIAPVKLINSRL